MKSFFSQIIPSRNDRVIKSLSKQCQGINELESSLSSLPDSELASLFSGLKKRRIDNNESLDSLLPECFALVRESSKRAAGMRHFDVQLIGGMILHQGQIAEMKTGEGKTLVATLAASLNALDGKGVHIVTVNDYLARRDSEWMGKVYNLLGLSVGVVHVDMSDELRKQAYNSDITYCTNNELGFDYLRDHLKFRLEDMVLREPHYSIVDEVDSILIDEARTPLIISGPSNENKKLYSQVSKLVRNLDLSAFEKDEKFRTITLSESGIVEVEKIFTQAKLISDDSSLFDPQNMILVHHVTQALRAFHLFRKDHDYIVENNSVIIIDEFTGRKMEGRRYSDGLHQALEAKESVTVQQENQTLASITYQNLFRQYKKLAGMTGTAITEMQEFQEIYSLDVIDVPTNMPMIRKDENDSVYRTCKERDNAVIEEIKKSYEKGQPVLIGTVSIERSEAFSKQLKKAKIPHNVLNARNHEAEANIIAQAGRPKAITIATNMAGRGTDIQLGGNIETMMSLEQNNNNLDKLAQQVTAEKEKVIQAGGLLVIGTERHESRRIDNQLRGRSGRQGDPGQTRFFISLEDDLMRIFGSEKIDSLLKQVGLAEGEAIVHSWIDKAIEKAQQKVEARNFDIRKQLLKFDDVVNDQRKAIFEERTNLMQEKGLFLSMKESTNILIEDIVEQFVPKNSLQAQWDIDSLQSYVHRILCIQPPLSEWSEEEGVDGEVITQRLKDIHQNHLAEQRKDVDSDLVKQIELSVLLQILDMLWKEHLQQLDNLRQGIGLRAYAQRDPLNEFRQEAFELFEDTLNNITETSITMISHMNFERQLNTPSTNVESGRHLSFGRSYSGDNSNATVSKWSSTPRNSPCPCGSGKKYKHCHGKL